jgi:hypothetical protein
VLERAGDSMRAGHESSRAGEESHKNGELSAGTAKVLLEKSLRFSKFRGCPLQIAYLPAYC